MPDDLPDDEEATRIVCLVKNKQPLVSYQASFDGVTGVLGTF